jgi:hypothetical protein
MQHQLQEQSDIVHEIEALPGKTRRQAGLQKLVVAATCGASTRRCDRLRNVIAQK